MATSEINNTTVHRKYVETGTVTLAGDARTYIDVQTGLPSNAIIIGVIVNATPNVDWVRVIPMIVSSSVLRVRYHNEYSGSLSGKFGFHVSYVLD